ncbi:hypothetical protein GCM10022224_101540 [Nonomuraea antimicrobica]|uniref:Uncharacterized protein n=1 Tax=Nonomuraea antimicrobica TaxID=561173 RepID=A0ABP7EJR2_9ACTN
MSRLHGRRGFLAGAGLLTAAHVAGVPGTAVADTRKAVEVVIDANGLSAPSTLAEGCLTLRVRATRTTALLLVRLRPGRSLDAYLRDLLLTNSANIEERKAACRRVEMSVDQYGGAVLTAQAVVEISSIVTRGAYHLIAYDYADNAAKPVVKAVKVEGAGADRKQFPGVDGTIIHRQDGTRTRIDVAGAPLLRNGRFLVVNASNGLNEAVFIPVAPGTTATGLQDVFDAIKSGKQPPSIPFRGQPVGLAPLSRGRSAAVQIDLPAGPYVLLSHIVDPATGHPRAYDGAYQLLTLT